MGRERLTNCPAALRAAICLRVVAAFVISVPAVRAGAQVEFSDVTVEAGVDYLQWDVPVDRFLGEAQVETGGAAAGDFDGDGWVDLFVTRLDEPDLLFRNLGDGTFDEVSDAAGLGELDAPTNGAAFADIDNDGDLDLYLTAVAHERFYLFVNDGHGHFDERGDLRGLSQVLGTNHFGFGVGFGDFDRDGWLDVHTNEWQVVTPRGESPLMPRLMRNRGPLAPGVFTDVTEASGAVIGADRGLIPGVFSFTSRFSDLDHDGWPDLAVAADFESSALFWNQRDGTFVDGTELAGVGREENGMGADIADYDNDGRLDWFVTSIFDPAETCEHLRCFWGYSGNRLYRNLGNRQFEETTDAAGVRDAGWGWGTVFFDYDHDGRLDLAATNGFSVIASEVDDAFADDPMRVWHNEGDGRFVEIASEIGVVDTRSGKALLTFDYDRDGDLDLFVVNNGSGPTLYRNDGGNQRPWLRLALVGRRSNRQGVGAHVRLTPRIGGPTQLREVTAGPHFLGQSEVVAHFGVGADVETADLVRIRWPRTGAVTAIRGLVIDQQIEAVEPPARPRCGLDDARRCRRRLAASVTAARNLRPL